MSQRPNLKSRACLWMAAIVGIVGTSRADVTVRVYHDESDFHFDRTGIPDLDQRRYGLANFGNCHCVPTCTMNLFIYAGGHGFPEIDPGPGAWGTQAKYLEATDLISDLGQRMAICYGDGEVGKCDPTVCDSDGDCVTSCGSRDGNLAIHGLKDWLGPETSKFVIGWISAKHNFSPRLHELAKAAVLPAAPLMRINYGRYEVVAYTPDNVPIYRRAGGHAMSFVGCRADGSTRELWTCDPWQDEGDVFGQSPFAHRVLDVTEMTIFVTEQYDGGPIVSWYTRAVSALEFTPGDSNLTILDIVAWILPTGGYTWTSDQIMFVPQGDQGFGITTPDPTVIPIGGGTLFDLVPDAYGVGLFALVLPEAGPSQIRYVDTATSTDSIVDELQGVVILCSGRSGDVYALANETGGTSRVHRLEPAPGGGAGDLVRAPDTLSLPFALSGGAYDSEHDQVVIASSGAGKLVRAAPDLLGAEILDMPTTVPLSGRVSVALEPGADTAWLASAGSDSLYGLTVDSTGTIQAEELSRADIVDPTGLAFTDDGLLFVRTTTDLVVLRRNPSGGGWDRERDAEAPYDGLPIGARVVPRRTRSNFDSEVHHPEGWYDIDAEELPDIGDVVRLCPADVDGDLIVGVSDLLALLAAWGPDPGHPADLDDDGTVGVSDLLIVLAGWGSC